MTSRRLISSLAKATTITPKPDPLELLTSYLKLKQCTIRNTQIIHTQLLKTPSLAANTFVSNSLISCYVKSGLVGYAYKVFDKMDDRNVVSWNIMISGFNHMGLYDESWGLFCMMCRSGVEPNEVTYGSVLSGRGEGDIKCGEVVYAVTVKNGVFGNGYVRVGMVDLFAKSGRFRDALRVFYDVSCGNVVCWNAIISGSVKNGESYVAVELFRSMCSQFVVPNGYTFSSVLTACASIGEVGIGKGVQGLAIKLGATDVFVRTAIVDLYAKCGDMEGALREFWSMPVRNVVVWTTIISGFGLKNDSASALDVFREMRKSNEEINSYTVTSILSACAEPGMADEAMQIHSWTIKNGCDSDPVVAAALINTYSKNGAVCLSEMVFEEMEYLRNNSAYAALISSFSQNQNSQKAVTLLRRMLQEGLRPDKFCISSVLGGIGCLHLGRQIHSFIHKTGLIFDVSVASSLFTMYSKCDKLKDSYDVFEQMLVKDNISWASMISGCAEHGHADQAVGLFREMLHEKCRPDQMILTAILTACASLNSLQLGKEVHSYTFRTGFGKDILVGGSLVNMYSKCSDLEHAKRVFFMLPYKDRIACSSLVSGYAQNGFIKEAVLLFHEMMMANIANDSFTISSVLGAVACLNRAELGTQLHAVTIKKGLDSNASVGSSLVTVYSKCGSIEECHKAFRQIENPDLIGWTAIIMSCAQHGKGVEALKVYDLMRKQQIKPDVVTFVGVLSACSHAGFVEEGYFHFNSMSNVYGIEPNNRHYACMVDLLGRSGRLKEAENFINNMPIEPDALVWGTLLAACKLHGNVELGRLAARKVIELEPSDAGAYISLSNIYANAGKWEEVENLRVLMKGAGVKKEPAWSVV